MKTKIIPFDLETAKKIQAGEIEGRIVTANGLHVRILCFDKKPSNDLVALVTTIKNEELCGLYNKYGVLLECRVDYTGGLKIELPEEEQKHEFKVGDIIKIHLAKDRYDNWIAIVAYVHGDLIGVTINNQLFVYDSKCIELVESNKEQYKFKPFDKVLVRNKSNERWHPSLYATTDGLLYYTIDCKNWQQCIPYEGNEHLVSTTDKPKESC